MTGTLHKVLKSYTLLGSLASEYPGLPQISPTSDLSTQSLDYTGRSNNNTSSVFIIIPCADNFPINYLRPPTITVPSAEEKTQPTRGRLSLSRE